MTRVATYYQLQDSEFQLTDTAGSDNRTVSQTVSVVPVSGEGALVTWMARSISSGAVTYTVTLNNTLLNTYTQTGTDRFVVQETIHTNQVNQGANDLEFQVTSGNGTLGIGDVMLWHRVEV